MSTQRISDLCGICGNLHSSFNCELHPVVNHVADNVVLSKARLTLPSIFSLESMIDGRVEVAAKEKILKGSYFGPLVAPKLITLDPSIIFPLKLFSTQVEDLQESFFDTSNEDVCNWIMFINPAAYAEEQNLICFQDKCTIMYIAIKDIEKGNLLKVWYAPHYAEKMKMPLLKSKDINCSEIKTLTDHDLNTLLINQQKISKRENWTCKFCSKLENNIVKFAHHMIDHYKEKAKNLCSICKQRFSTNLNLQKHIKTVHSSLSMKKKKCRLKENPRKLISGGAGLVGGPLLNNISPNETLDTVNVLITPFELNNIELNSLTSNGFLENDYSNLIETGDKELNDFYFEINETEDSFVCDICLKPFAKLKYLLQHLRSHTGRFNCKSCLKIFSRKENLQVHKCAEKVVVKCDICSKTFTLLKYLRRHKKIAHGNKITCIKCKNIFFSENLYEKHKENCIVPSKEKENQKFSCSVCHKNYSLKSSLHKHLKSHNSQKKEICEICAKTFKFRSSLVSHLAIHGSPSFSCDDCGKKFYRKDSCLNHKLLHKSDASFSCDVCKKKFKTKKYLNCHKRLHSKPRKEENYQCSHCEAKFSERHGLTKHIEKHNTDCKVCNQKFEDWKQLKKHINSTHSTNCYTCPFCEKVVKLRGSLVRHIKTSHKDKHFENEMKNVNDFTTVLNGFIEAEKSKREKNKNLEDFDENAELFAEYGCNLVENRNDVSFDNNLDDIVENLENVVNIYNKDPYSEIINFNDGVENKPTYDYKNNIINFEYQELQQKMNHQNLNFINNGSLSMPDLTESNQDCIL